MTRKDYELIAEIMRAAKPIVHPLISENYSTYWQEVGGLREWNYQCEKFADRFAQQNPKFNREKFLRACGIE